MYSVGGENGRDRFEMGSYVLGIATTTWRWTGRQGAVSIGFGVWLWYASRDRPAGVQLLPSTRFPQATLLPSGCSATMAQWPWPLAVVAGLQWAGSGATRPRRVGRGGRGPPGVGGGMVETRRQQQGGLRPAVGKRARATWAAGRRARGRARHGQSSGRRPTFRRAAARGRNSDRPAGA